MKIELTDDEWTTVLVALDYYGTHKTAMAAELYDRQLTEDAGSAEWCWQKIWGARAALLSDATAVEAVKASLKGELPERNITANAIGAGETLTNTLVDPFGLPTWNDT